RRNDRNGLLGLGLLGLLALGLALRLGGGMTAHRVVNAHFGARQRLAVLVHHHTGNRAGFLLRVLRHYADGGERKQQSERGHRGRPLAPLAPLTESGHGYQSFLGKSHLVFPSLVRVFKRGKSGFVSSSHTEAQFHAKRRAGQGSRLRSRHRRGGSPLSLSR